MGRVICFWVVYCEFLCALNDLLTLKLCLGFVDALFSDRGGTVSAVGVRLAFHGVAGDRENRRAGPAVDRR